jgi:hypothetical protein
MDPAAMFITMTRMRLPSAAITVVMDVHFQALATCNNQIERIIPPSTRMIEPVT